MGLRVAVWPIEANSSRRRPTGRPECNRSLLPLLRAGAIHSTLRPQPAGFWLGCHRILTINICLYSRSFLGAIPTDRPLWY